MMIAKYRIGELVVSMLLMAGLVYAWTKLGGYVPPLITPEYVVGWFTGVGTGWLWRSDR